MRAKSHYFLAVLDTIIGPWSPMLKLTFQLELNDLIELSRVANRNQRQLFPKNFWVQQRYFWIGYLIIAPISGCLVASRSTDGSWTWIAFLSQMLFILGLFLLFYFGLTAISMSKWALKWQLSRTLPEGVDRGLGSYEVTLTDDEIRLKRESSDSKFKWDSILRFAKSKDSYYLFFGPIQALIVPFRTFANEQDKLTFEGFVESKVSKGIIVSSGSFARMVALVFAIALILGVGFVGFKLYKIYDRFNSSSSVSTLPLKPFMGSLDEPVNSIRVVAYVGELPNAAYELAELLKKYPEYNGAILKNYAVAQRHSDGETPFVPSRFVSDFKAKMGSADIELHKGSDFITESLFLQLTAEQIEGGYLNRFKEENESTARLPWNMWLRVFWDPQMTQDERERQAILDARKWAVNEYEQLPKNLKNYIQHIYKQPMALPPGYKPPVALQKKFPPPCDQKKISYRCLSEWNLQVGKLLDQVPLSKTLKDPDNQLPMPDLQTIKYFGWFQPESMGELFVSGKIQFGQLEGASALIEYLEKRNLQVSFTPEWQRSIRK